MIRRKVQITLSAALVSMSGLVGITAADGGAAGASPAPITIGVITSLSGAVSANVPASKALGGLFARVNVQNAHGGVNGHQIKLKVVDDQSTSTGNQLAAKVLVDNDHVFAVMDESTLAFGGAKYLQEKGIPVIGAGVDGPEWGEQPYTNTAQLLGVEGVPNTPIPSLKSENPQRYASLSHPSDDYSYDIFAQAGELLGPNRFHDLDPLEGLEVRHLIAVGVSQSSARLAGYVNGVHAMSSVYDAFLLVVYPNSPCALNSASAPAELPQTFGPNGFHLLEWYRHVLRDDLDVPIIVLNSESEASECHPNSQPDTDLLRWWEIAGTSHTSVGTFEELEAMGFVVGTSVSFAPAFRGAFLALQRWLVSDTAPPHQPRLLKEGIPPPASAATSTETLLAASSGPTS